MNKVSEKLASLVNKNDLDVDKIIVSFEKELKKNYNSVLRDLKKELANMFEKFGDEVSFQDMAKYNRLNLLFQKIKEISYSRIKENITAIEECKENVFVETFNRYNYSFMKTTYLNIDFVDFDPNVIKANLVNKYDLAV
jgi:hypothetical protein